MSQPYSPALREKLDRWTREIAQPRRFDAERRDRLSTVLFRVGKRAWAVETRHALGTASIEKLTPLPGAPDTILGVTNYRGQIVPVLDFMRAMSGAAAFSGVPTCALLLGAFERNLAFGLVEAPSVYVLYRSDLLKMTSDASPIEPRFLQGVTREGILLLDTPAILDDPRWTLDAGFSEDDRLG